MDRVIDEVRQLDIFEIIDKDIGLPKKVSGGYHGICPFHTDISLGSFVVTPKKGIYHCFACDAGGDLIDFVKERRGITYTRAAFEIALEYRIISDKQNDEFWGSDKTINTDYKPKRQEAKKKYCEEREKLEDDKLDIVFNAILDCLILSDSHEEHLLKERGLSLDIINKTKYRSTCFSSDNFIKQIMERLGDVEELEELNIDKVFRGVPGFFQRKINGKWKWLLPNNFGIFIPIKNAKGQIIGLQVRKDKKEDSKSRYSWLSSQFVIGKDGYRYGTSSNSPLGVIYPDEIRSKALFITEGMFKAEIIANKIGAVVITVQGVRNWKGIEIFINDIEEEIKKESNVFKGFDNICIAWDNDMKYNYQVYMSLKSMSDIIAKDNDNREIFYLQWIDEYKGIDDLLLSDKCKEPNSHYNFIKAYKKDNWDTEYKKRIDRLVKLKKLKSPNQITRENLKNNMNIIEK